METRAENPPNGASPSGDGTKKVGRKVERVTHTAGQVWDRTRDSFSDMGNALDIQGRVDRNPYGTVAAALGIGFVLGGGLFTPLTGRIVRMGLRIGMRLAVLPMLKQELAEIIGSIEDEGDDDSGDQKRSRQGAAKTNANKGRQP